MLGKVAEKRDHDPSVFLGHFVKVKAVCEISSWNLIVLGHRMLQQKSVGARLTPEVMLLCLVTNVLLCLHNTVHASQKKKKIRDSLCIKYMNISFLQCNFTHWIEVAYYGIHFANREDIVIAVWYKVAEISTSRRCQWCSLPLPSLIMNHKQGQGLICMLLTECRSSLSCTL
jgi:hypothetical protein